jgi:hypothetical protein
MVYKIEVVERDVRIAIDENKTSEQLIGDEDIDTLSLDETIRSKIEEAVRSVGLSAPAHLLEEGHTFDDSIFWESDGSGWILLPDDFMRLIAFRMSDWERTCYNAISVDDPLYDLQSSRYKGIRGNVQKPVCAIVNRPEGKALEFYSSNSEDAYVKRASYIPYPEIDDSGGIDISERCYTAVVYTIASLVLTAYGATDRASEMSAMAKSILES